jgi:hypothetical protein
MIIDGVIVPFFWDDVRARLLACSMAKHIIANTGHLAAKASAINVVRVSRDFAHGLACDADMAHASSMASALALRARGSGLPRARSNAYKAASACCAIDATTAAIKAYKAYQSYCYHRRRKGQQWSKAVALIALRR